MANIDIAHLQPGMIVNSDVITNLGRLLLPAGTEITGKHLHVFRTWGITEVDIQSDTEQEITAADTAQIDPVLLQEVETELNELFRHTDREHPFIKKLYSVCITRKVSNEPG
jgi:hypothetical protein